MRMTTTMTTMTMRCARVGFGFVSRRRVVASSSSSRRREARAVAHRGMDGMSRRRGVGTRDAEDENISVGARACACARRLRRLKVYIRARGR